ncbi:hypothetical protein FQR65_LT05544 [Abscondita terminalis]|nr:hypothetical protein FQR65_LT05544 [Abscondita terminalis]
MYDVQISHQKGEALLAVLLVQKIKITEYHHWDLDISPNGHNTETWTQRQNELLDTSSKLDILPKFLIGRNAENGHNAEIGNWTYRRKWTQRRKAKTDATWIGNRASQPKL